MLKQVNIPHTPNPEVKDAADYSLPRRGRPFLFQVLSPGSLDAIYPVLLALHANPESVDERMTKSGNMVPTYGGFVEFIWPDELDAISASGSSGAFISPETGLTSGGSSTRDFSGTSVSGRRGTIAWERQEDFLELFRSNGCVFNSQGVPVLRGRVMMIFDRGAYIGHFTTFERLETEDKQFNFALSWEFKVERAIYRVPVVTNPGV
jgi:hypothetical protein